MWELDVVFGTWCALSLLLLSFCTFLTKFRKLVQLWWCWLLLFLWCSRCYLCSRWEKKNCHVFEVRYVSKKVSHWCSFSWILWLLVFFKVISVSPLFLSFKEICFALSAYWILFVFLKRFYFWIVFYEFIYFIPSLLFQTNQTVIKIPFWGKASISKVEACVSKKKT